ncbi:MAG TPA: hypothetical protein VGF73_05255 [Chthoniobacterales bacterium]
MKQRIPFFLLLLAALALTACPTTNPKKDQKKAARTAEMQGEEEADVDFQAFIGRLRKAVKAHDMNTVASMMTPDFAYVLGATPADDRQGAGVFQYWDENGLWVELDGILSERFVKKDDFMVAPAQFADPAAAYNGYRAGIRRVNGSWKFVYFVNG